MLARKLWLLPDAQSRRALNQAEKELGLPLTVDDEFKSES